jgi:tetratricopeptide (TPR) repeat protein
VEAETQSLTLLEEPCRLSRSNLWQIQRKFFEQQGVEAWRQGIVPHYITNNPYIANAYANVVFGFLRDCYAAANQGEDNSFPALDLSQPIYIVELGAGSGRFAYHFLKKFGGFFQNSALKDLPVQYVMTDFAGRTLDSWREHTSLKPFVESGLLDFALFDAGQPGELSLIHSGKTLAPGTVRNPLVVIANYFFDGIPQDLFSIQAGRLYENLVTLSSPQPEPDLGAPELLQRIEIVYERQPVTTDYYDDPDFNKILQRYQDRLAETSFTIPTSGLSCIRYLNKLSGGRLMLLSADKGYNREEALLNLGEPGLNLHGSFSMMVNYHAIAQYTAQQDGQTLQASYPPASLCIAAFLFGRPPGNYIETRQAFNEAIEKGSPDDFFTLKKAIENHYDDFSLEQLLAYLRMSGWDANILLHSFPVLLTRLESASAPLHQQFYRAIRQVWDTYYPIGEEDDLPFHLAVLLQAMAFYPEALEFYDRSLQLCGPDPGVFYNLAMCHYSLRQLDAALTSIQEALELDPEFEPAKAMRITLQSAIGGQI